ncbi:MAG: hypothetical protein GVY04_20335 [Cyanobacteria bacterium]|jgi:hypothetical protein|nr:hypothetical protein [Cyanobacteria bacterium GSL.Bin1]
MVKNDSSEQKINIFYICNENQVNNDLAIVSQLNEMEQDNVTRLYIARRHHFHLMSKYFNLYNGYVNHELINKLENSIIYLIPSITNEDLYHKNQEIISKYKEKTPIVLRHYDPYIPKKFDLDWLNSNFDLALTYADKIINNKNIKFSTMVYDSYLYHIFNYPATRNRLACMIANNRIRPGYQQTKEDFKQYGIDGETAREARRELARYSDVDIYGREGWSPLLPNYRGPIQPFDQKYVILSKYKFNLIIDTAILDTYISEKILDSFLIPTVPVYLGTQKVSDYIPLSCYISMSDFDSYKDLIIFLSNMSEEEYLNYYHSILNHREKIFQQFSTRINVANQIYEWYNSLYNTRLGLSTAEINELEQSIQKLKVKMSNSSISNIKRNFTLKKMRFRKYLRQYVHS